MITPLSRSTGCLVEKYINSDFDHVVNVAEHMDQIKNVEANQANIDNVSDHMTQVVNVSNNMEHVVAVSTDMETVKAVHADEVDIGKVADNITEVVQVANGMEEYQVIEHYTLEQGQTTVQLDNILAQTAKVEVMGQMVDGTVLLRNTDFTVTAIKRIDLTRSYPKGTIIKITQVVYKNQDDPYIVIDELSAFNRKTVAIGIDADISPYEDAGRMVTPRLLVKSISYVNIEPIPSNTLITSVNVTSEPDGVIIVRTTNGDIRFSSVLAEAFTREEIGKTATITHPYYAVGGESTITVPYLFDNVQAVYINGLKQVRDYSWEWTKADGQVITIAEELLNGDLVEIIIGGEYEQLLPPDIDLSDVYGVPVFDLVDGLVISPNQSNLYPKLKAFNAIYELVDDSVSYTVKSFTQSVGGDCVIMLSDDTQITAKKVSVVSDYKLNKTLDDSYQLILSSTQDALQRSIKAKKFKTNAFHAGFRAINSTPIGGSEWVETGNIDLTKKSTLENNHFYDVDGKEFSIKNDQVSPQMFGATDAADAAQAVLQAINCHKPCFLESDIRIESQTVVSRNNLKFDFNNFKITCSMPNAGVAMFELNGKKKLRFENAEVNFLTSGKFMAGRFKNLTVNSIDIVGGTLAFQFNGEFGAESENLNINFCTHDGSNPVLGSGGFLSAHATKNVKINHCIGKNGGEFIDCNNLCSQWTIQDCVSENYHENHLDINSSWHIKVVNHTLISTISGLRSRPIWVSDSTMSVWPDGVPNRLKNSNFVTFENSTLIIENFDYTEAVIFNVGTEYNPFITEGRRLVMKWIGGSTDCRSVALGRDKFKFGIYEDLIRWTITDHDFLGCGILVHGTGKVNDNTFDLKSDVAGTALEITLRGGTCSDNSFYGWTGSATASTSGGVIFSNTCKHTTFAANEFYSETDCYSVITSSNGGTNRYIQNGFSMTCTDVNGVRENSGDVVVYN